MFLEEDELQEEHDDDGLEEIKTFSIEESVKMKREQSKRRKQEFEEKLKVLQEKTDRLKRESGYE